MYMQEYYKQENLIQRQALFFLAVFIFTAALSCDKLFAESQSSQENQSFESDSYVKYIPSRKQEAGPGKVAITEAGSEQSYELKAFGKLPINISINTQYIGINGSTDIDLPTYLTTAGVDIETTLPFFDVNKTYLCLGVNPSFNADTWNFSIHAFHVPMRTYLIYQLKKTLTLIGGAAIYPGFETRLFPIAGFIYKPNDKLTFNITTQESNIVYQLNDKTALFFEADAYLNEEFTTTRVDAKDVVLEYREISFGSGIRYEFNRSIEASLSVGDVINRVIKYKNTSDVVNIDDGLYTEFKVAIKI